jgi:predicted metalloenzyme YecM
VEADGSFTWEAIGDHYPLQGPEHLSLVIPCRCNTFAFGNESLSSDSSGSWAFAIFILPA